MTEAAFLTVDDMLAIHGIQIARFAGRAGLRGPRLLESAVAQAQATFDGLHLHADVFEMAAAYHFHRIKNHAFVDGNKRVGLAAARVFLDLNGVSIEPGTHILDERTLAVARGELSKCQVAASLRAIAGGGQ